MSHHLNDLAAAAIDALGDINAIRKAWRENVKAGGYASHFKSCPQIDDHLLVELLTEIVQFDEDPAETLAEISFQDEMAAERELELMPRASLLTDAEWDLRVAQGVQP